MTAERPQNNRKFNSHAFLLLLLVGTSFSVYAGILGHDFLFNWDDQLYVTQNETVRGFSANHLKTAFSRLYGGNYAPVQIISYMLDYSIWGLNAGGFLLTNAILHALNGLLFYFLVLHLSNRKDWAFLASFLFLIHPVQVESVAWISQRKNLLSMLFFLIAFILYTFRRIEGPNRNKILYAASLTSFALALLAKSAAIILPLVLWLYDICFIDKRCRKGFIADKMPFLAMAAFFALVTIKGQAPEFDGGRGEHIAGNPLATLLTMLPVLARYLGLLFRPTNLSAVYTPPVKTWIDTEVILSLILLLFLVIAGLLLSRKNRPLFFWYALFFIGLIPVSQVVPLVTLMNDRYLYFPMLGAAAFAGGTAVRILDLAGKRGRIVAIAVISLFLLPLPVLSAKRVAIWENAVTLWSDVTDTIPHSKDAWVALAEAHQEAGRMDKAEASFLRALSIEGMFAEPIQERKALNGLSVIRLQSGRFREALPCLLSLTSKYPDYAPGFLNLGYCYYIWRKLPEAEQAYLTALRLEADMPLALVSLGNISLETGKIDNGRKYYMAALVKGGDAAEIHYNLACLETVGNNLDKAVEHLKTAIKLGYAGKERIMQNPELAPLRKLPRFGQIVGLISSTP